MDRTIRNLDEDLYRSMKAQAALSGKPLGELVNEALSIYLAFKRPTAFAFPESKKTMRILDIKPVDFPPGNENLSREIDEVLYGGKLL